MTRPRTALLVVPLLALGLSACGQAGDDPATTTPSTTPSMTMPMGTTTSAPPTTSSSPTTAEAALVTISDFEFEVSGPVAQGATVTVRNGDREAHTVTSTTGGFDVKVDPGATATFTAPNAAGSYAFACSFHAEMTGTLVVR